VALAVEVANAVAVAVALGVPVAVGLSVLVAVAAAVETVGVTLGGTGVGVRVGASATGLPVAVAVCALDVWALVPVGVKRTSGGRVGVAAGRRREMRVPSRIVSTALPKIVQARTARMASPMAACLAKPDRGAPGFPLATPVSPGCP